MLGWVLRAGLGEQDLSLGPSMRWVEMQTGCGMLLGQVEQPTQAAAALVLPFKLSQSSQAQWNTI